MPNSGISRPWAQSPSHWPSWTRSSRSLRRVAGPQVFKLIASTCTSRSSCLLRTLNTRLPGRKSIREMSPSLLQLRQMPSANTAAVDLVHRRDPSPRDPSVPTWVGGWSQG